MEFQKPIVCRILIFMWSFEPLCSGVSFQVLSDETVQKLQALEGESAHFSIEPRVLVTSWVPADLVER